MEDFVWKIDYWRSIYDKGVCSRIAKYGSKKPKSPKFTTYGWNNFLNFTRDGWIAWKSTESCKWVWGYRDLPKVEQFIPIELQNKFIPLELQRNPDLDFGKGNLDLIERPLFSLPRDYFLWDGLSSVIAGISGHGSLRRFTWKLLISCTHI